MVLYKSYVLLLFYYYLINLHSDFMTQRVKIPSCQSWVQHANHYLAEPDWQAMEIVQYSMRNLPAVGAFSRDTGGRRPQVHTWLLEQSKAFQCCYYSGSRSACHCGQSTCTCPGEC